MENLFMLKRNLVPKIAYDQGYRIKNGIAYGLTGVSLVLSINNTGYYKFTIGVGKRPNRKHCSVKVHRLVAYQKYGELIFDLQLEVRHLDGDRLNNLEDNIILGTHSENQLDIDPKGRKHFSINASNHVRKFTDEEVEEIKSFHVRDKSYKKTMEKFRISSKATLHYILNIQYQTSI